MLRVLAFLLLTLALAMAAPAAAQLVDRAPEPVPLDRWPVTTLEVRLVHDGRPAPVEELRLILETDGEAVTRPGRQPPGGVELLCPVREGRVEGCPIPRGRWHLRLSAEGFAPTRRRGVRAGAEAVSLGKVELRIGGTIAGRVLVREGSEAPPTPGDSRSVELALSAASPRSGSEDETAALERIVRRATIDADGRFEIVGVPEGRFVVAASQPGFAPARLGPVEVAPGELVGLPEPLLLRRVRRLLVEVRPATDGVGRPWTVRLDRYEEDGVSLREGAEGEAGPDGVWRSPVLAPGRYSLRVLDFQDGAFAWRELDLAPAGPEEELVTVELSVVPVEGRVLLEDEPLAASVTFHRRGEGGEWASVSAESDEEGALFVVLPKAGAWRVDVRSDDAAVWTRDMEVDVERRGSEGIARVTVEVPATRISGVVVDEQDRPASAQVGLIPIAGGRTPASVSTDGDGRFELLGLVPGSYLAQAGAGEQRADGVRVDVGEGMETPPLRLVLRDRRTLIGVVVSDAGPVAGAEVMAIELGAATLPDSVPSEATSGPDGRFQLPVRQGVARMLLVTRANGFALDVAEVAEGTNVQVYLSRDSGVLRLPGAALGPGEDGKVAVALLDGVPLGLALLDLWARSQGSPRAADGSLAVPGMPPGQYARCRLEPWEALMVLTGNALPVTDACSRGRLAPGGELTLGPPG